MAQFAGLRAKCGERQDADLHRLNPLRLATSASGCGGVRARSKRLDCLAACASSDGLLRRLPLSDARAPWRSVTFSIPRRENNPAAQRQRGGG